MNSKLNRKHNFFSVKEFCELMYWRAIKLFRKKLNNDHYKFFYTTYFSLPEEFYDHKNILDIGCGPRGSLEWADNAKQRIGVDPLAEKYMDLGAKEHRMAYVNGYVENLPFPDNSFDIISSFNSLDHVDNIEAACHEIKRTLKVGGLFLLIVDIHQYSTLTEPQTMNWKFVMHHFSDFEILEERRLERIYRNKIYWNLRLNKKMDDQTKMKGVLVAKLKKRVGIFYSGYIIV